MKRSLRHILGSNLNVLIIPEGGAQISAFRVRRNWSVAAATSALVIVILCAAAVFVFAHSRLQVQSLSRVQRQNQALREELQEIGAGLDVLRASVARNEAYAAQALALAGMEDGDALLVPGLGGPDEPVSPAGWLGDPELEQSVLDVSVLVDSLLGASESQGAGYEMAIERLEERRRTIDHTPSLHPVRGGGWFSSGFGYRRDPFSGRRAFHAGVDISCPHGTPVLATADGVVVESGRDRLLGRVVRIDHGNGIETIYGHNSVSLVQRGDTVRRGQTIARVGDTGRATAPHLHYAVKVGGRPANPHRYLPRADVIDD